jgi:hypothetical protein
MSEKKNVFFRVSAMILFVVSVQKLIRGILSGLRGSDYTFAEFGFSNMVALIITIVLLLISIYLFLVTKPFSVKEEKE